MIVFTKHARDKFAILRRHNVRVTEAKVVATLLQPDVIDHSHLPLLIAQAGFDEKRVLRVVYKQEGNTMKVITFYPGRNKQYEKN